MSTRFWPLRRDRHCSTMKVWPTRRSRTDAASVPAIRIGWLCEPSSEARAPSSLHHPKTRPAETEPLPTQTPIPARADTTTRSSQLPTEAGSPLRDQRQAPPPLSPLRRQRSRKAAASMDIRFRETTCGSGLPLEALGQPIQLGLAKPKSLTAFRVVAWERFSRLTPLRSARSLAVWTIRAGSFGFCFRTGSGDM